MSLLRSAATVSAFTMLSRVTGLIRDMLIARYFGAGAAIDAFYVAFRIPNMLRRLFAEGAFSQAFVPMLSQVKEQESEGELEGFINRVFTLLAVTLFIVSVAGVVASPLLVWMLASGFAGEADKFAITSELTRWMFPYIFFMSLVAFAAAVLNTYKRFAVPAFTPILLNVSFIGCTLFLAERFDEPVWALACAVLIGGVLQLSMQFFALRRMGVKLRIVNPMAAAREKNVRQMLKLMVPAVIGVSVTPISLLINTNIASWLGSGSITWLNFADRLMEFPTALLGVALGTVLLPGLSSAFARGDLERYNTLLDRALKIVVLIGLPASVGLWMLAEGLTAVLYQGNRFTGEDVLQTAVAMQGYAVGLLGIIAIKIVAPAFYSRKDLKTPLYSAIVSVAAVQLCNLVTVPLFAHAGLAFSLSVGACVNVATLLVILVRRGWFVLGRGWLVYTVRIIAACAAMGALLWYAQTGVDWIAMQSEWMRRLVLVAGVIVAAVVTYFSAMFICGWRAQELRSAARD